MQPVTGVGQNTGTNMRLCASQWLLIAVVVLLGLSSMLSGCGKKGPLYLPDEPAKQAVPGAKQQ
jgi:predicted small lipoprotein YifL